MSILAKKERQREDITGKRTDFTSLIESSSERKFFELSHHIVATHREFIARFYPRIRKNLESALEHADCFVANHPELDREMKCVRNIIADLIARSPILQFL